MTREREKAKKQAKIEFANNSETVAKIGDNIGYYLTVVEDLNVAQNYEKAIEEMTTDYVIEVAKKYITPEKCAISILLPNEEK